jgi:predicted ArsR family transcriptional regulator
MLGAGRGPRLAVLEQIKRSGAGMNVADLAKALDMSYMGVKAHCLALVSSGHLGTWREPTTKGRPRLLYRLAASGERLFADEGDSLALGLLREAAGLFGSTAPQKMLARFFRSQQEHYREYIGAQSLVERAGMLVRLRDQDGCMSALERSMDGLQWAIVESHNPLDAIMRAYPEARALEENMVSEVIGVAVKRTEIGGKILFAPV